MTPSRIIRWGITAAAVAVLLGGAVALVQSFLGPIGGYRCEEPARTLAGMNSMDDLRADPEATWDDAPTTPISSGYTVYGAREELEKNIVPLLE